MADQTLKRSRWAVLVAIVAAIMIALLAAGPGAPGVETAWAGGSKAATKTFNKKLKQKVKYIELSPSGKYDLSVSSLVKVEKFKSSNPKVLQAKVHKLEECDGSYYWKVVLKSKKAGKATLSYTINGKKYKVKATVEKFTNPFEQFKIGDLDLTSRFNKSEEAEFKTMPLGILTLKLAKGWTMTKGAAIITSRNSYNIADGTELKEGTRQLQIRLKHSKTGKCRNITVW